MPVTERWSRLATRVLAPNAGPMTLDGTNTYVLRVPGSDGVVIVDPGPSIAEHQEALRAVGRVELILLTHHHSDHAESAPEFAAAVGAPVRALDATLCIDAGPLEDGELIDAAGCRIRVVATPGHTRDSVSFLLPDDQPIDAPRGAPGHTAGSVLTGDTILGRGTTVVAAPDGTLADYLASLDVLEALGAALVLPAHGPALPDLAAVASEYRDHRVMRLESVVAALRTAGLPASTAPDTIARVTDLVYPDVDPSIRYAAEASTAAQLAYLAER